MQIQDLAPLKLNEETKSKLEEVLYNLFVDGFELMIDGKGSDDNNYYTMMMQLLSSRLTISAESGAFPGCGTIMGFIDEVELLNNLDADYQGEYRGYNSIELLEDESGLIYWLDKFEVEDVIKNDIIKEYKLRYSI